MARVNVIREVRDGDVGAWQLCFQWCCYRLDDGAQYGYRFVWRRPENGSIQAARGQARIPSFGWAKDLMEKAANAGWGQRDGDLMEAAAERLRAADCKVELSSGYVGWSDKEAAYRGSLTPEQVADSEMIQAWSR